MADTPGGKSPLTPLCKGGKGGILQPCTWGECTKGVWSDLAHDPAEEREGVAASDFLDVRVGVPPLDQTTDDVLAIRG